MDYISKCLQCDKEFASQKPAKYCGVNCRVTANRSVTAEAKSVTADVTAETKDFTRAMVETNIANGDTFIPNWYKLGFESKGQAKESMGWNNL